ncbi:2-keto-4-pentenoate hydratase (plasmid) [Vibrio nigripulchritudo]|uniref:2-oxo-3-hexenedioate decarboxylase n=1 Tax=Vibrio nigripulchritudo TaxID=28173 RepID=UPI00190A2CEE|nr:2-oxo-3-hexenedioate decarboxylase [Vibrio nigripulchritudo]BCL73733.1 2-keto-4-pentenoate hydratase [Vibrio nigripulchritudo]BDU35108.1 2-keto-4-pentenoate hydratase [Vibrio nigripulchritudo]
MENLTTEQIQSIAALLEDAELNANEVPKITDDYPNLSSEEAYDIQWAIRARKVSRGHNIVGMKMGLTSWAKMAQMGVNQPCYGFLADYFVVPTGGEVDTSKLIHPKIEAEIAFVLKQDLKGPGVDISDVTRATDFILPAVEVIDSRYKDFRFDIESVIADNTSSTRFFIGDKAASLDNVDVETLGAVMEVNGEVVEVGAGAAVLGHPAASVVMLVNMLSERNEGLPAGTFVLVGAMTPAITVKKGDNFCVHFQGLGTISGRFT